MLKRLDKALEEWRNTLTSANIILSERNLNIHRKSTIGDNFNTPCKLILQTQEELTSCLSIANKNYIKVFPISAGYNHGYNSATPAKQDVVIFDLQNLNQIIDYNEEFGYVVIEPGVTFSDLYLFLAGKNSDYMMSGFTGNTRSSVMANALDRGTGKGGYGNRELSVIVKEVILATGEVLDLADRAYSEDVTTPLQYSITGMDIGNLFYQSSLAIVTKMVVHLEPIPEYLSVGSATAESNKKFLQLIDQFRNLNKKQLIKPTFGFTNIIRTLLSSGIKRPDTNIIKTVEEISALHYKKNKGKLDKWNSSFAIYSSCKEEAGLKCNIIRKELENITSSISFENISKQEAKQLIQESIKPDFIPEPQQLKLLFSLGYTNNQEFRTLYWASPIKASKGSNPVEDGCGFIYFVPKIPFSASHIKNVLKLLETISRKHDIELPILFQVKSKNLAYLVLPIIFYLFDKLSEKRAKRYYAELVKEFESHGYVQYRLNNIAAQDFFDPEKRINGILANIKALFDSKDIFSSRYNH